MAACKRRLVVGLVSALADSAAAVEFDPRLLRGGSSSDLLRYQVDEAVPEGEYTMDITLNQQWMGRRTLRLRAFDDSGRVAPCYDRALLESLGLAMAELDSSLPDDQASEDRCVALASLPVPASEDLDFGNLRLRLEIAQSALVREPQDLLPVESWDAGVTAGFLDYRLNLHEQHDTRSGQRYRLGYLGLDAGLNTGVWYWRHEGQAQVEDDRSARYRAGMTSVRRDLPAWRAQVTLGDGYVSGDVFDSSALRGLRLSTDERMLPRSQRGFAPVVRGVADSTALLSIRQRGALLYEATVPPGPFEVPDLPASGLNDDLQITLREADGRIRRFDVPYRTAPLALREGASRMDLGAGFWRDDLGRTGPGYLQGSWQQGLDSRFSVHGGAWIADDYQAVAAGTAINSRMGAFGLTAQHARTSLQNEAVVQGQALRLSWRQRLSASATDLSANLTRRQDSRYYTFNESMRNRGTAVAAGQRWRAALALHQSLPGAGRLSLSASGSERSSVGGSSEFSAGYYHHMGSLSYGLTLSREHRGDGQPLNAMRLTFSMPLGERRRGSLSSNLHRDAQGRGSSNVRWSSTAGEQGQWGYGVSATRVEGAQASTGLDANLLHRGGAGEWTVAVAQRPGWRQMALGARGAVVGHAGGVTLAQPLGESFAIVHAPGAQAARIQQFPGVQLDARGYAVVPSLSPYSVNTVELDPQGMSQEVELQVSGQSVIPRAGAASLLRYPTRSGRQLILKARDEKGHALPFGALVNDMDGAEVGMVGQGSRLHVRSASDEGRLEVVWGEGADARCWLEFTAQQASACMTGRAPQ